MHHGTSTSDDKDAVLGGVVMSVLDEAAIPLDPARLVLRARRRHHMWRKMSPVETMLCLQRLRKRQRVDVAELSGHLYAASKDMKSVVAGCLVSSEYRELGMTVLPLGKVCWLPYIPAAAEHRFFEFRASSISPGAGLGLFLRASRQLRPGTVVAEYRGRPVKVRQKNSTGRDKLLPYVVRLRGEQDGIDGCDADGHLLSLAPLVNDNGPTKANVEIKEFPEYPGRVFLVSVKEIMPEEEIFSCYGAAYWGYETYEEIAEALRTTGSTRLNGFGKTSATPAADGQLWLCRICKQLLPRRVKLLHAAECADASVHRQLSRLGSLPRNPFTALDYACPEWRTPAARRRCAYFVNGDYALTLFNSHEPIDDA